MKQLLITFIFLLLFSQASAQELISTSGDHYVSEEANAQISWSLGETIIETQIKLDGILTQGFHQTHLVYVSVPHPPLLVESIKIYPNPFEIDLTIELTKALDDPILNILDLSGRAVISDDLSIGINRIDTKELVPGFYTIQIKSSDNNIFNHKLIKM